MENQPSDWTAQVRHRLKQKRQLLFSKDSICLQELFFLMRRQDRRALVLWALELAQQGVQELELRYPDEQRPARAVEAAGLWASGRWKMPQARRAILDCHAFAREITDPADIALCHAVGQACSVVHTPGHAPGFPIYELTALVRRLGPESCREAVERRVWEYTDRLLYWQDHWRESGTQWADFLCRQCPKT